MTLEHSAPQTVQPPHTQDRLEFERTAVLQPDLLRPDRLHLLVFGPGKGEACLLVFPDQSLGIVDGCGEPSGGRKALEEGRHDPLRDFIRALDAQERASGKSPPQIRFVCLTHPHDDHYAGLGRLMESFASRIDEVWVTAPVSERYSRSLLEWVGKSRAGRDFPMPDSEQVAGLSRVIEQVKAHRHIRNQPVIHLSESKHPIREKIGGIELSIQACGPADADVDQGLDELLLALRGLERDPEASVPQSECRADPNRTSAALIVRWGRAGVLLAGDLLNGFGSHTGWQRAEALQCLAAEAGPVQVVSVAHHASEAAHHAPLWDRLQPTLTIVTPFRQALGPAGDSPDAGHPPRPGRIRHLCASSRVVITSPPAWNPAWTDVPAPCSPAVRIPFQARRYWAEFGQTCLSAPGGVRARRNGVLVTLSSDGRIERVVLAGDADEYR